MRTIITGVSGFLGGSLLRSLTASGVDCIGVSRSVLPGIHRVASYGEAPSGDCLIHCAETNDRSLANAGGEALETAARNTLSLLLKKRYKHIIYASSAVLYGDRSSANRMVTDPVTVTDTYSRIKRESEISVLENGGSVVRLSNLYGPQMSSTNVLNHILIQLCENRLITMRSLAPVRDFLWIDDAVSALSCLTRQQVSGIFNVGSGQGTSIGNLVKLAQRLAGTNQDVSETHPLTIPSHLVLDISATRHQLDWCPQISLDVGVRQLIDTKINSDLDTL